ncbi:nuclear transport factor 2 family protein [Amycolatopsis jejuensis]|uniref:nuclear transport factor 2 family protein n=1 Tax=Amycolatopsis jejuensis TaxID=330084 RepID=UPI00068EDE13|nr:nuclear transport factor 2 family protein [Amycolatopsis jejuensis]
MTTDLGYDPDELCAEFLAPWNDHDVEAAVAAFTDDAFWEFTVGSDPWGTAHTGRAAVRAAIEDVFTAIPDIHYELVRYHAGSTHLTMEVLVTGTKQDGTKLKYQACDILRLDGNRVAGKRSYRKVVS